MKISIINKPITGEPMSSVELYKSTDNPIFVNQSAADEHGLYAMQWKDKDGTQKITINELMNPGKTKHFLVFTPCRRFGTPYYDASYVSLVNKSNCYFDGIQCCNTEYVTQAHAVLASLEKSDACDVNDVHVVFITTKPETLYDVTNIHSKAKSLLEYHPGLVRRHNF